MQVGVGVPDDEHEELGAPFYCSSISIYSLSSHFLISWMRSSILDLEYSGLIHRSTGEKAQGSTHHQR